MQLSARMEGIIGLCPVSGCIADIGCDHGQVSAELIRRGRAQRVIAGDISAPSLAKARRLAARLHLEERIDCRLGSGLAVLRAGEADGAILAGMGAPLIISLLMEQRALAEELSFLVLAPNIYPERLRAFLTKNGWLIAREDMVAEEGKFYPLLLARRGSCAPYSRRELLAGRWEGEFPPALLLYLRFWEDRCQKIVETQRRGGAEDAPTLQRACDFAALRREFEAREKQA